MASQPEFLPFRRVQAKVDAETLAALERAAKEIRARINTLKLKPPGIGARVRAAQLHLVLASITATINRLWAGVQDVTHTGSKDAAKAAQSAAELMTAVAYGALTPDAAEALTRGLNATAEAGIESFFARVPRTLSAAVYRNKKETLDRVEQLIQTGLISGLSAKELATSVYQYVSPTTPGGASYAAMRLARTEINNAFHEQQKAGAFRPGVTGVKWNLSESHPRKDECNLFAAHPSPLGKGVYAPGHVPDKPHPHCFCFLTYITMKPKDFASALTAGDFDAELDRRTADNLKALGVTPVEPTAPPKSHAKTMAEHVASGEKGRVKLTAGKMGETSIVEFKDGSKAVNKKLTDHLLRSAVDQGDAEELASAVAKALEISAPSVYRSGPRDVYMSFIDGLNGMDGGEAANRATGSPDGLRMGIMDFVIGNIDRNFGNFMVSDDGKTMTAIDHSLAFFQDDRMDEHDAVFRVVSESPLLHKNGIRLDISGDAIAIHDTRVISQKDILWIRGRLASLESTFKSAGRPDWFALMQRRLAILARAAKGSGRLFG